MESKRGLAREMFRNLKPFTMAGNDVHDDWNKHSPAYGRARVHGGKFVSASSRRISGPKRSVGSTETRKRSKARDESILAWFEEHLKDHDVQAITHEVVQELRALKATETSESTANRHMALLRAILNKCVTDWEVFDSAPKVPMYRPAVGEPRWLTHPELARLERELPDHLKATKAGHSLGVPLTPRRSKF